MNKDIKRIILEYTLPYTVLPERERYGWRLMSKEEPDIAAYRICQYIHELLSDVKDNPTKIDEIQKEIELYMYPKLNS